LKPKLSLATDSEHETEQLASVSIREIREDRILKSKGIISLASRKTLEHSRTTEELRRTLLQSVESRRIKRSRKKRVGPTA
jgi:hypothetical protein